MRSLILSTALFTMIAAPLHAKDLGVKGEIFPINEQDIAHRMAQDARDVDWKALDQKRAKKQKDWLHNAPQQPLKPAKKTQTHYLSATVQATRTITTPVIETQPDGTEKVVERTVVRKGQAINAIENGVIPHTRMLIFNPKIKAQRQFALAAFTALPQHIKLVASGGDLKGIMDDTDIPIYYAYDWFTERFQLQQTPSLIGIGCGPSHGSIAVTAIGKDDLDPETAGETVRRLWYGEDTDQCF